MGWLKTVIDILVIILMIPAVVYIAIPLVLMLTVQFYRYVQLLIELLLGDDDGEQE